MTKKQIIKKLKEYSLYDDTCVKRYVAEDIIDMSCGEDDQPENYIKQVIQHGCISGCVPSLIYYHDAQEFYIKYIEDIENIINDLENETEEPVQLKWPKFNSMAWVAYEETMRQIADELGIEY
jgi:hypothetical protein